MGFTSCHDVWGMDVELLCILNLGTGKKASHKYLWTLELPEKEQLEPNG
jgi:hypothetical protein